MKRIISILSATILLLLFAACDTENGGEKIRTIPVTAVRLSYKTINLTEGESTNMRVFIIPEDATNQTVEWKSSNKDVATVDDGLIKAIKDGRAYVSASVDGIKDSCLVIVDKRYVNVSSISLPDSLEVIDGETDTLHAVILPEDATDKSIRWETSEIKIATVNNGVVEGKRVGETYIKATCGQHTDSCKIIVTPKIVITENSLTLNKNVKHQLTATIYGKPSDYDIVWSSTNESIVSVDQNGEITTNKGGEASIIATLGDKEAYCYVKVYVPLESFDLYIPTDFITSQTPQYMYVETVPSDATVEGFYWYADASIAQLDYHYGYTNTLRPAWSGKTKLRVEEVGTGMLAEVEITIKYPATEMSVYVKNANTSHHFLESGRSLYTVSRNSRIGYSITCSPQGAYSEDLQVSIADPTLAYYDTDAKDIVTRNVRGTTTVTTTMPYSGLSHTFTLSVQDYYLYQAGISSVNQGTDVTYMSFGAKMYSNNTNDHYIVNNVSLCDKDGVIVCSSLFSNNSIEIRDNGTNQVVFRTPMVNMTQKYGIYAIIQDTFSPFIDQWYFHVTYKMEESEELRSTNLFIHPGNWSADY